MASIKASNTLIVEAWPSGGPDDKPLVKIRDLDQERDDPTGGNVIVYAEEIAPLVAALVEAAVTLANESTGLIALQPQPPALSHEIAGPEVVKLESVSAT